MNCPVCSNLLISCGLGWFKCKYDTSDHQYELFSYPYFHGTELKQFVLYNDFKNKFEIEMRYYVNGRVNTSIRVENKNSIESGFDPIDNFNHEIIIDKNIGEFVHNLQILR